MGEMKVSLSGALALRTVASSRVVTVWNKATFEKSRDR